MELVNNVSELRVEQGHKTLTSAYDILQKHKRCLVVRPTGFGKSHMLAYLTKRYNKSLYVYPIDIIKESMKLNYSSVLNNTDFISYRGMLEKYKRGELAKWLKDSGYELIMFDEVHQIGAINFRELYGDINSAVRRGVHIIGVTATPDRMDEFDYQTELFKNRRVYKYNLHNCISDGLMLKPYYVHSTFDISDDKINQFKGKIANIRKRRKLSKKEDDKLTQAEIQVSNLLNASSVIGKHTRKVLGNEIDYMRFIVFFPSIETLHNKQKDVEEWFSGAFPDMSIKTLVVTSESEYRQNITKLAQMGKTDNTIDLVMSVDMLNMGYHVDLLTGVVMVRGTKSNIVYWQQIGRCMSIKAKKPAIIFDFVCNYKINPFYTQAIRKKQGLVTSQTDPSEILELDVKDLVIQDCVATYEKFISRLDEVYGVDEDNSLDKELAFMYTNRKMTIHALSQIYSIERPEILRILRKCGIEIEDESHLKKYFSDARILYTRKQAK